MNLKAEDFAYKGRTPLQWAELLAEIHPEAEIRKDILKYVQLEVEKCGYS